MKIGVAVVGAIIQDTSMLYKAINSIEGLTEFDEKVILMDGLPSNTSKPSADKYKAMLKELKITKSNFEIKCFDENIYFKNMLRYLLDNYDCKYWLVIQDDVVIEEFDIYSVLGELDGLDANIISFPHKKIEESTHWFDIIEVIGGYVATHGWSERCFILKSEPFKELIKDNVRGENLFIDTIYQRKMKTSTWKTSSKETKLEYWKEWKCYVNNDVLHKHLVAKRKPSVCVGLPVLNGLNF
jgi:hypothetical protein